MESCKTNHRKFKLYTLNTPESGKVKRKSPICFLFLFFFKGGGGGGGQLPPFATPVATALL